MGTDEVLVVPDLITGIVCIVLGIFSCAKRPHKVSQIIANLA